ncbi:MAG: DMT family transporter [Anaerolineae bacterium]|nr:MAG: DMT family transporter [Anaerolineae bacterium]
MENSLLYLVTVLIWGSTWIAIRFQLGVVAPELSIAYRFLLASLLLFAFSAARKLTLRFSRREHQFMALQGFFLFSLNYFLVYLATGYVTSGLVAVIFSSIIIFNVLFGALFLKNPIRPAVILGGVVGILGLGFIYWPELAGFELGSRAALGLLLATGSAVSASMGNIISARNQRNGLPVVQTNAWGMVYGGGFMLMVVLLRGTPITFEASTGYIASLLYLSVFGSIVAFGTYLTLLGRMGADRAAYVTVLFPVIALVLSILFEGLELNTVQWAGVVLVPLGNVIALAKRKATG